MHFTDQWPITSCQAFSTVANGRFLSLYLFVELLKKVQALAQLEGVSSSIAGPNWSHSECPWKRH